MEFKRGDMNDVNANNNYESSDDESSLSSNDSIWNKVGLWSLECSKKADDVQNVEFAAGCERPDDFSLDDDDDCKDSDSVIKSSKTFLHSQKKQPTLSDEISSSSSDDSTDSILEKTFFDRPIVQLGKNNKNGSDSVASCVTRNDVPCSKNDVHDNPGLAFNKQSLQDDRDNSSDSSSSDSILEKTYFERKKLPIHSYYDYCKYYPNNTTKTAAATTTTTTGKSKTINPKQTNYHDVTNSNQNTQLPQQVPLPTKAKWHILLLMDHREFGCSNNFLQTVQTQINTHLQGNHAEITTLPSADYLYVARLLSTEPNTYGQILDERVMDILIERKAVQDVCSCLVTKSKKYPPLSFFEAQMYKLMNCGMGKKLFVMEGDEDKCRGLMCGAKSGGERERRLKRVKTLR